MEKDQEKIIRRRSVILIVLVIVLILLMPILLVQEWFINFNETGQIGDTIGGITAPFINIGAALLVYVAFLEQKRSNDTQLKSLAETQKDISRTRFHEQINLFYERYADFMTFSQEIITQLPNQPNEEISSISNIQTIYFNKCDFILTNLLEFIDSYITTNEKDASMEDIRLLISVSAMYSFRIGELMNKLDNILEFAGDSWKAPCHDLHMHCYLFKCEGGAEERLFAFGIRVKGL